MFPPPPCVVIFYKTKTSRLCSRWESVCQSQSPWGQLESYRCLLPHTHSGSVDYVVVSTDLLGGTESLCGEEKSARPVILG